MNLVAAAPMGAATVKSDPKTDWQHPKLARPHSVLGAGYDGSFGFGQQLVLEREVLLPAATRADAFEAAAATGGLMSVVSHPTGPRGATQFGVGQATHGNLMHTGSRDVDVWRAGNLQPDLTDVVDSYQRLGELHFAPNVAGLVQGEAAYLPVLEHGAVGPAAPTELVSGLTNLGAGLYARPGFGSASIEQALTSAALLSRQAGHAFAVTKVAPAAAGGDVGYMVSPLLQLDARDLPTRSPIPRIDYSIAGLQLTPTTRLHEHVDGSVLAIVDDASMAVPRNGHDTVGATPSPFQGR